MKRQAMRVSIKELRELADDLEKQGRETHKNLNCEYKKEFSFNERWMINIINKTPECSDTWEIEK